MKGQNVLCVFVSLGLLLGCTAAKVQTVLPPLPTSAVRSPHKMPAMAKLLAPLQRGIEISWSNQPIDFSSNYVTGIIGSTNLSDWYEVARVPYSAFVVISLTNRPAWEFFRAYNSFAP